MKARPRLRESAMTRGMMLPRSQKRLVFYDIIKKWRRTEKGQDLGRAKKISRGLTLDFGGGGGTFVE